MRRNIQGHEMTEITR
jgi:hypothetical protein